MLTGLREGCVVVVLVGGLEWVVDKGTPRQRFHSSEEMKGVYISLISWN